MRQIPEIEPKISLTFTTKQWKGKATTKNQRAHVMGRFIEQLMAHFDDLFANLEVYA